MKSKKRKKMNTAIIIILVLFGIWVAWGYFSVRNIEQPKYQVLESDKEYEIRQYEDYIIAEADVTGDYRDATNSGFIIVADYIFGNNTAQEPVAMTSPVVNQDEEEKAEPIAMTSPVVNSENDDSNKRTIAFIMPSKYTLETLPKPNDDRVKIREIKGEKIAVLKFSWWVTENRLQNKKDQLKSYLERDNLKIKEMRSARYNPPWTPPFMLHNEVWAILEE